MYTPSIEKKNHPKWGGMYKQRHLDVGNQTLRSYTKPPRIVTPDIKSDITLPILDDPISPNEVDNVIKRLNANKAAGYDGIPPAVVHPRSFSQII